MNERLNFSVDSSREEVDIYLRRYYGHGLDSFYYSIRVVARHFGILKKEKSISIFKNKLRYLETSKDRLIKLLDSFLTKTELYRDIGQQQRNRGAELTPELKEAIKIEFNLQSIFQKIDEKIRRTKKIIAILENIKSPINSLEMEIQPLAMIEVVWSRILASSRKRHLKDIRIILEWFSKNYRDEILELYGRLFHTTEQAIWNSIERYKSRYSQIAFEIYAESFSDIDPDALPGA